jgi:hypothetical protein
VLSLWRLQVKGEFSYDHWADLTAKRKKAAETKADPMGGIMDLMKDMYEEGDENTKKMIGEAMVGGGSRAGCGAAMAHDGGLFADEGVTGREDTLALVLQLRRAPR